LAQANQRYGDEYLFGGTRQDAPPYDNSGAPAASSASQQAIQIDPEGNVLPTGVVAETIFADSTSTIFEDLEDVAAALRGTGDAAADRATVLGGLNAFADQAQVARRYIGTYLHRLETVTTQLDQQSLLSESTLSRVEAADFAESAIRLTESQRAYEAILQTKVVTGRRTLLDLLG
jgi:flagellin-like hook-associated protein FlgL